MKTIDNLTKEDFEAYEKVRESGSINMMDAPSGCTLSGLDRETYMAVLRNYTELNEKYHEMREYWNK